MPYISPEMREEIYPALRVLMNRVEAVCKDHQVEPDGTLNYVMTSLLLGFFNEEKYSTYERGMGLISCVGHEFYRRRVAPYEDQKSKDNGDVFF